MHDTKRSRDFRYLILQSKICIFIDFNADRKFLTSLEFLMLIVNFNFLIFNVTPLLLSPSPKDFLSQTLALAAGLSFWLG